MKPIELRPYQQSFIDDIRNEIISGQRRICGVAPCGAGKTIMTGWIIREAVASGKVAGNPTGKKIARRLHDEPQKAVFKKITFVFYHKELRKING